MAEMEDGVTLVGLSEHVKPVVGETDEDRLTGLLNPPTLPMVMVDVPVVPAMTDTETGLALIV